MSDSRQPTGRDRVVEDAAARRLAIELVSRPAADTLEQAAAMLGLAPHFVVKSLVVKRSDGSFLFALVPHACHLLLVRRIVKL